MTLFGRTEGIYPSKIKGRGIFRQEEIVYEFQSAYPCVLEDLNQYTKELTAYLKEKYQYKAKRIPILPEVVDYSIIKDDLNSITGVPIGVDKNTLNMSKYDFKNNYVTIVLSFDTSDMKRFVKSLIMEMTALNDNNYFVVDAIEMFENNQLNGFNYCNKGFTEWFMKFKEQVESARNIGVKDEKHTTCIMIGIADLVERLGEEANFGDFIVAAKKDGNISFILIDSSVKMRNIEYEDWYKAIVNNINGIWIGGGANQQTVINITRNSKLLNEESGDDYGFVVIKGSPSLIKLIDLDNLQEGGEVNE